MEHFLKVMYKDLTSDGKNNVMQNSELCSSWENFTTKVTGKQWGKVSECLFMFEKDYTKETKVDLKGLKNYMKARNDLLFNIQGCSKMPGSGKYETHSKKTDMQYICEWITWIDKEIVQEQKTSEHFPEFHISEQSPEIQNCGRVLQNVVQKFRSLRDAKGELLNFNMSLNKSISDFEKKHKTQVPIRYFEFHMETQDNRAKTQSHQTRENHTPKTTPVVSTKGVVKQPKTTPPRDKVIQNNAIILDLQRQLDDFRLQYTTLLSKYDQCEKEKEYWMNRMSKVAGERLTNNNPAITDLSDPNRPQKLGEKYAELYDNEWTDALEILGGKKENTDWEGIQTLAKFLRDCHGICKRLAGQHIKQLFKTLLTVGMLPLDTEKQNKESEAAIDPTFEDERNIPPGLFEARKDTYSMVIESVKKIVLQELTTVYKEDASAVKNFISSCVEICWEVVIQRPELYFLWPEVGENERINQDMFSFYTRSGKGIQTIVWPALLLYENGPVLRKGTYQPFATS